MKSNLVASIIATNKIRRHILYSNVEEVYKTFKNPSNYLIIHELLMKHCSTLTQYYYMKALKEANFDIYLKFAEASINSVYGRKAIFCNILDNLYSTATTDLDYCHSLHKGLPKVVDFYVIAHKVL